MLRRYFIPSFHHLNFHLWWQSCFPKGVALRNCPLSPWPECVHLYWVLSSRHPGSGKEVLIFPHGDPVVISLLSRKTCFWGCLFFLIGFLRCRCSEVRENGHSGRWETRTPESAGFQMDTLCDTSVVTLIWHAVMLLREPWAGSLDDPAHQSVCPQMLPDVEAPSGLLQIWGCTKCLLVKPPTASSKRKEADLTGFPDSGEDKACSRILLCLTSLISAHLWWTASHLRVQRKILLFCLWAFSRAVDLVHTWA